MSVPAGTFQAHAAIGVREDLADVIHDISPMDTPFMSNVQRGKADQVLHEWQTDSLAAASATNAQIEGGDATGQTATPTVRRSNYCQLSWKVPRVSGTLRASNTAGRRDEFSYQTAKRGRELKRDIESALLGDQAATAGAAGSARACAGVGPWLWTNAIATCTSATTTADTSGFPQDAVASVASSSAITETRLKSCIASIWTQGGDPTVIMAGATDKQTLSGFSGIATQYKDNVVGPAAIIGAADVYVSDFGTHYIVANRFMSTGNVFVLDLEYWEVAYLRSIQRTPLAKTGDSDRALILAEYTLAALNGDASGKVYKTA
jgi:hypothetical protein